MTGALIAIGGGTGTVALAIALTLGLGPVAALLLIWSGGLAATIGLAASVVSTASRPEDVEEASRILSSGPDT